MIHVDLEHTELTYITNRNVIWYNHFGKQIRDPFILYLDSYPRGMKTYETMLYDFGQVSLSFSLKLFNCIVLTIAYLIGFLW